MLGIDRAARSFSEATALLSKRQPALEDIAEATKQAREGLAILRHGRALLSLGIREFSPLSESGPLFEEEKGL